MENMEGMMVDEDGNPIYGDEMMGSDEEEMEGHEMMQEGDSYGMEGSPDYEGEVPLLFTPFRKCMNKMPPLTLKITLLLLTCPL